MNTPHKISDILPSTCQKLLKLMEICLSSDKTNLLFFETRCRGDTRTPEELEEDQVELCQRNMESLMCPMRMLRIRIIGNRIKEETVEPGLSEKWPLDGVCTVHICVCVCIIAT